MDEILKSVGFVGGCSVLHASSTVLHASWQIVLSSNVDGVIRDP